MAEDWHLGDRLRGLRTERQISVRTLAGRAGFSPSFISQVELGQASPSIASLERIATALGVTLTAFFPADDPAPSTVIRSNARQELASAWSRARIESLTPPGQNRALDSLLVTIAPGGRSSSTPLPHAGEVFAFLLAGHLVLTIGESPHDLAEGDAVTLPPQTPYRWENTSASPARLLLVATRAGA